MRRLLFVLLLCGCSAAGKQNEVDAAIATHSAVITAITEYVANLQQLEILPTAAEAKAKLDAQALTVK